MTSTNTAPTGPQLLAASRPSAVPAGPRRERLLEVGVALALSVLIVYAPSARFDYVSYDDPTYTYENPMVARGLSLEGISWAASAGLASNWHPLTWISLMLDVSLFGMSPGAFHVVNVAFHAANALLLLFLLRRLTGTFWRSAAVAGLFALHPLHVESVAWIAERKDVLATFFGLLTIGAWAAWTREPRPRRYALALILYALGLTAKPMLVTWPFVLLLLDYWPLRRTTTLPLARLVREKAPFFALSAASSVATFLAQRAGGAVQDTERYPLLPRVANAAVSWAEYAWKAFWPHPLAFFYPYPAQVPVVKTVVAAAFLTVVTAVVVRGARRAPYALTGWLFYLGTLVPVLGLVQVGNQRMADRYTYIPYIGLFVAVVFWLSDRFASLPRGRLALAAAGGAALAVCAALAARQVQVWKDSVTLYEHAIAAVPDNHPAHLNLGTVLYALGRHEAAVAQYREVVRILPRWGVGHHNLGAALVGAGRSEEGVRELAESVRLLPARADYRADLAGALSRQGRTAEAMAQLREALRLDPDNPRTRTGLAQLELKEGGGGDAVTRLRQALARDPENAPARADLAAALAAAGSLAEAEREYQEALRLRPGDPRLHNNLAAAYLRQGKEAQGLLELARAVEIDPGYVTARFNLGNGLLRSGQTRDGVRHLIEVLRSQDPSGATLRVRAAAALGEAGPAAKAAVPALQELGARDPASREAAAAALARIGAAP
jgi:Tfp pilus assembly protein PilF